MAPGCWAAQLYFSFSHIIELFRSFTSFINCHKAPLDGLLVICFASFYYFSASHSTFWPSPIALHRAPQSAVDERKYFASFNFSRSTGSFNVCESRFTVCMTLFFNLDKHKIGACSFLVFSLSCRSLIRLRSHPNQFDIIVTVWRKKAVFAYWFIGATSEWGVRWSGNNITSSYPNTHSWGSFSASPPFFTSAFEPQ